MSCRNRPNSNVPRERKNWLPANVPRVPYILIAACQTRKEHKNWVVDVESIVSRFVSCLRRAQWPCKLPTRLRKFPTIERFVWKLAKHGRPRQSTATKPTYRTIE
jgi:hypothetical protein